MNFQQDVPADNAPCMAGYVDLLGPPASGASASDEEKDDLPAPPSTVDAPPPSRDDFPAPPSFSTPQSPPPQGGRKLIGRPQSDIWAWFTDASSPQRTNSAMCKHCGNNVFYYKKSKQASHHLNNCEKFRPTMMALDPHERPTWFAVSTKRQKQAKALSSMKAPTGISFGHPSAAPIKTMQEPDIVLPNRQALANKYLDICYHEVKEETDRRLGAPDTQDIFGPGKTKWGGNDVPRYPNGYPFEHLANFVDSCKDVVRFIRNNGQLKSALSSLQKANHLGRLVMPAPTRWCTLQQCLVSLHESESLLHDLVSARDFITGSADQRLRRMAVKETVTAVDFVSKLEHCISVLSPIDKWIKIFQSDRVPVSEVFDAFVHQLPHAIGDIWSLNLHESKYIVAAVKARW
ncbi:hypothetical protein DYB37_013977, partial [Aphanomyces astaci]